MKKKLLLIALAAVVLSAAFLLADTLRYDAAEFLEDALEYTYHRGGSRRYLDEVGIFAGDRLLEYRFGIQAEAQFLCDYFDIDASLFSRAEDLCMDLYDRAKFELGRAVRTDGGWDVEVTVYPLDAVQKFLTEDKAALMADWSARYDRAEFDAMPEEEYEALWLDTLLAKLEPHVENADYLAPQTVTAAIRKGEDGRFSLTAESAAAIDALIIAY